MAEQERVELPAWLGWARLAIGLGQGVALYWLTEHAQESALYSALMVCALFAPVLVIGGLGAMAPITLAIWAGAATVLTFALSWYDFARGEGEPQHLSPQLFPAIAVLAFTAHHLIAAGDQVGRWIAPYERYFDLGWRHGAQLCLAGLFTGAFWLVVWLGSALFDLINLHFLRDLIQKNWFHIPATFLVFAAAIHLTDLRSGLVRGVRALGLILLSWLLPIMTGLAIAFLVALVFTGVQPLWNTRAATAILLSAAGALVVLINAAYQDGAPDHPPGMLLRWAARAAALAMTPLAILAGYALYLRIGQYGLTPERIYAAAALIVGVCYAIAYAIGAFWPRWMKTLELGNIISACVVIVALIALFSPIADPARLSVDDQMRRLATGKVSPEEFDYAFLRFSGARYGREALARLKADRSTQAAQARSDRATRALALQNRWQGDEQAMDQPMRLHMHPEGGGAPASFLASTQLQGSVEACRQASICEAALADLDHDGRAEMIVATNRELSAYREALDHHWVLLGSAFAPGQDLAADLRAAGVRTAAPRIDDLVIGERRYRIAREPGQDLLNDETDVER